MGARHVLAGLADQGAQLLGVGVGEMVQPDGQGRFLGNQAVAPLLGRMQGHLLGGRSVVLLVQRGAHGGDLGLVQLAHELADVLHLAALAFEIGDALGLGQGIGQLVGQLQALEQVGAQRQQILAEVLQGVGLALEIRLAGVGGAFEFGLELQVEFAAFGNEVTFDVVAFFGFA